MFKNKCDLPGAGVGDVDKMLKTRLLTVAVDGGHWWCDDIDDFADKIKFLYLRPPKDKFKFLFYFLSPVVFLCPVLPSEDKFRQLLPGILTEENIFSFIFIITSQSVSLSVCLWGFTFLSVMKNTLFVWSTVWCGF